MDLEARREARRRKILENSDSRLRKITGVEDRSTKSEIDSFSHSNCITSSTPPSASSYTENVSNGELKKSNISTPNHIEEKIHSKCYYVIVVPIITNILLVICSILVVDTESLHLNKIFIPFITFEIIYFFLGSDHSKPPSLFSTILSFVNIKSSILTSVHLQASQKYFYHIFRISQDMMVYFFIFIVCYAVMHYFI